MKNVTADSVFRFDLKPNCWFDSKMFDSRKSINCFQMHCSKILEHTGSTVMGSTVKSNFKARWYDPCCNGKSHGVSQGLYHYDSSIFEKSWQEIVSSSGLFTIKFLQLDKYLRDSDGYQFKIKFNFRFGLLCSRPNEILKPN